VRVDSHHGAIGNICPEIVEANLQAYVQRLTPKDSCLLEDICEETYYTWLKDPAKPAILSAIKKANRDSRTHLNLIRIHAVKNWFAAAW